MLDQMMFRAQGAVLSAVVSVLHIGHTHDGVGDSVVDHRVNGHCNAVLGQQLHKDRATRAKMI